MSSAQLGNDLVGLVKSVGEEFLTLRYLGINFVGCRLQSPIIVVHYDRDDFDCLFYVDSAVVCSDIAVSLSYFYESCGQESIVWCESERGASVKYGFFPFSRLSHIISFSYR